MHIDVFCDQILVIDVFQNIQHLLAGHIFVIQLIFPVLAGEFIESVSMRALIRLQRQHTFFFHKAEDFIKGIGISLRQIHHGDHLIISVFADDMVVIFRETLVVIGTYIFDRNLVFHPFAVLRIDVTKPLVFKI